MSAADDMDMGLLEVRMVDMGDGDVAVLIGVGSSMVTVTWNPDVITADEREAGALLAVLGNLKKVLNHVLGSDPDQVVGMLDLRTGVES